MVSPIPKTLTLPLVFSGTDTTKALISVPFEVSRIVLRTASILQVVNDADETILCIRSNLVDSEILFHFAPTSGMINLLLNHNFYLTNKNINSTFTFQVLLGQTTPLSEPDDIGISMFLTLEMYA